MLNHRMDELKRHYELACTTPSDIFMHLDVLKGLSSSCSSILELGTRSCVSSWAFLMGLAAGNESPSENMLKTLISNDLEYHPNVRDVQAIAKKVGVCFNFVQKNDLTLDAVDFDGLPEFDIVFIDTWHIYGQLRRELEKFHNFATKYIILHDTDIDAVYGESVRMGHDISEMAKASSYSPEEITQGLRRAIIEFLQTHQNWFELLTIHDGIGLTVLARRNNTLDTVLKSAILQKEDLLIG